MLMASSGKLFIDILKLNINYNLFYHIKVNVIIVIKEYQWKNQKQHICLVDGSTYIFRAYHALPPLTRKSDGFPVGAISGFCNMLDKLVKRKRKKGITISWLFLMLQEKHLEMIFIQIIKQIVLKPLRI